MNGMVIGDGCQSVELEDISAAAFCRGLARYCLRGQGWMLVDRGELVRCTTPLVRGDPLLMIERIGVGELSISELVSMRRWLPPAFGAMHLYPLAVSRILSCLWGFHGFRKCTTEVQRAGREQRGGKDCLTYRLVHVHPHKLIDLGRLGRFVDRNVYVAI